MELSELDLETIVGSGWFKKLTGISTPSFLKKVDDVVNESVGWDGLIVGTAIGIASGGGSCFVSNNWLICAL